MSTRTFQLDADVHEYLLRWSVREHPVQEQLRERTAKLEMARMQISPEQGQFMGLIAQLVTASRPGELGPPKFVEVGVFTGYSALSVALAVPTARVTACDVNEEWTNIAREFWREAGVEDRIDLRLAPGGETLQALLDDGAAGTYDLAFLDADKPGYVGYYEQCLQLLRTGGVILIDNVLWSGRVVDPSEDDEETEALREISRHVYEDSRVDLSMLPLGDGLTIARKR